MNVYLKQALRSGRFAAGAAILPAALIALNAGSLLKMFREGGGTAPLEAVHRAAMTCFESRAVFFLLPVLCVLPYASSFVEDLKSGYIRPILMRTDHGAYLQGKISACALSGSLEIILGMLLTIAGAAVMRTLTVPEAEAGMEAAATDPEALRQMAAGLLGIICLYGLAAMLWAAFGMLISMLTGSVLVAYLGPFIAFYLLQILHERYLTGVPLLSPSYWLTPDERMPGGRLGSAVLIAELLVIVCMTFIYTAGRRLKDA